MYMRVTRTRIEPSKYDEGMRLAEDVLAAGRTLPGFQGLYAAGDRSSGRGMVVTLWDTQEHANFSRDALGDVIQRAQALQMQMEAPEIYEVMIQH